MVSIGHRNSRFEGISHSKLQTNQLNCHEVKLNILEYLIWEGFEWKSDEKPNMLVAIHWFNPNQKFPCYIHCTSLKHIQLWCWFILTVHIERAPWAVRKLNENCQSLLHIMCFWPSIRVKFKLFGNLLNFEQKHLLTNILQNIQCSTVCRLPLLSWTWSTRFKCLYLQFRCLCLNGNAKQKSILFIL